MSAPADKSVRDETAAAAQAPPAFEIVIDARRLARQYWRDVWRYRELFLFLVWRDVLVRYKQTSIGILWAVLRPLLQMIILTLVFSRLARLPATGGVPYPLLVLAGTLPWQFFATGMSDSATSLLANANLITKVYFPRVIAPLTAVGVSLVDFVITLALLGLAMLWYGFAPGWRLAALPLFAALAFAAALGGGLWLSALTAKYRDVRHVVPFLVQIGFFVSPVGYASDLVPAAWRPLFALNPLVGIIDGFRWSVLDGATALHAPSLAVSTAVTLVLLVSGHWYFRRTEREFADVI